MNKVQKENLEKGLAAYRKEPALCIELLTPLLNTDLSDEDRGRVVYALGNACFISAENTKAMQYLMEALHYYNSHNNREMLPHIKSLIGVLFMNQGNLSGSMDAFERNSSLRKKKIITMASSKEVRTWGRLCFWAPSMKTVSATCVMLQIPLMPIRKFCIRQNPFRFITVSM